MGYGKLQLAIEKSLELLNLQRVPMFISKVGRMKYKERRRRREKERKEGREEGNKENKELKRRGLGEFKR